AGLGSEFARQLAAGGKNLVLIARRGERLRALADELAARHGAEVDVIEADMSDPTTPQTLFEQA
ncbi:MAG: SDR family NAD(P)-dependent oxidoreductase, partial [Gammaproteobacteria bacterium]|nr:SDR family NAD(P)-dependent oxidoreductase [Acidobacteriota bacterium]NIM27260.1 SDR family NAD(P)-dependent oxidoreductase [Gammaproteobacteria bacterium]NIO24149.1 SDR family NAD(P)-dependent oxidoreductase [Gammaproteobacteria bacterium]NIT12190.1 SDR family NAD(P)-dependent oxidoreductase [Acidobacteriota bacterium]NIT91120.1 SDR family NAD(P)-dependent oxidoreductase [Gammaproteobacteria bacterium]